MTWYLLKTKPRQEQRAKTHLENQAFSTYLPILTRKDGASEPLFPGYIFITQTSCEYAPVAAVRSTRGITGFVRFGSELATAPDLLIESIRSMELRFRKVPRFQSGQEVEFKSGPFEGLRGIFHCENRQERCVVLLTVLNRVHGVFAQQSQLKATV